MCCLLYRGRGGEGGSLATSLLRCISENPGREAALASMLLSALSNPCIPSPSPPSPRSTHTKQARRTSGEASGSPAHFFRVSCSAFRSSSLPSSLLPLLRTTDQAGQTGNTTLRHTPPRASSILTTRSQSSKTTPEASLNPIPFLIPSPSFPSPNSHRPENGGACRDRRYQCCLLVEPENECFDGHNHDGSHDYNY